MSITVRNVKKEEFLNVVSVDETTNAAVVDKSYFETSADQVKIDTAITGVTGETVAEALGNLATGVSQAGKVDDVQDVNGASIVTNKIAKLSKAAVGLGNVDNTADSEKIVKEAGKVTKGMTFTGYDFDSSKSVELSFDGSVKKTIQFDLGAFVVTEGFVSNELNVELRDTGVTQDTYNSVLVDRYGRVRRGTKEDYALKSYVNTQDEKKLDKAGGTVTGALAVNGGVTIGGNLTVNGTTTTVNSTTLAVTDKLIEVAHGNTTKLTTPAGLVAPKYDGTNSGALVFDGDGIASVGDVTLDANGNIDVTKSNLQPLATRTGLVDGNLVKYDGTNQTLVDTGKKVGDLQGKLKAGSHISIATDGTISATDVATAAQGTTADAAKAKADSNATEIANIKNGTNGTKVKYAEHADTADSATNASSANTANSTKAGLSFYVDGNTSSTPNYFFNGNKEVRVYSSSDIAFAPYQHTNTFQLRISDDFKVGTSRIEDGAVTDDKLATVPRLTAGVYTALQVNEKGRATGGQQAFAVIGPNDDIPSNVVIGGFVLRTKA